MSTDETEPTRVIPLDGFEVVAIPGEGVNIIDEDDNRWHVGGPHPHYDDSNELVRAYREAVDNEH